MNTISTIIIAIALVAFVAVLIAPAKLLPFIHSSNNVRLVIGAAAFLLVCYLVAPSEPKPDPAAEKFRKDSAFVANFSPATLENDVKTASVYIAKLSNLTLDSVLGDAASAKMVELRPELRARFTEILRDQLWEDNIDVAADGRTLTLVGGKLASNKTKKQVQEALAPTLRKLGFTLVRYKFTKYDAEWVEFRL